MKILKDPQGVWREYRKAVSYNDAIDLYETVTENENFFIGKQWEGCNAPDLQKPVLNILKRCVSYFIATIVSDDIGTQFQAFSDDQESEELMSVFSRDIDRILEKDHTKTKFRKIMRNAAVDGDGCLYWFWDDKVKTGTVAEGDVRSEVAQSINILFGNPYEQNVQRQPYIMIVQRKPLDEVQDEAKENGINGWEDIRPDRDDNQGEAGASNDLVTVVIKMWKENGKLHALKTTSECLVRKEWDTDCSLYPVAWMRWDRVRGSYHGQAAVTGLIPNQIAINKLFAMYIKSVEMNAFPKVVYDISKFGPNGWTNRVGEAIGVYGDVGQAAVNVLRGGDVSGQVMDVIERCISYTKDCIGANDAALGSIRPENTAASAIIATQQASAAPLELQRQEFFDFVEQSVLIILDFMGSYYGKRNAKFELPGETQIDPATGQPIQSEGGTEQRPVDYSQIKNIVADLEVSVGSSAYWSELAQMQTMDNLLQSGIISDTVIYLESIPDKWLPNKQELIESAKQMQQAQMQQQQQAQMQMPEQGAAQAGQTVPSGNSAEYFNSMLGGE